VKAPIIFLFCFARSGGTMLNRCLSNIDELVVLSEVHPINDVVDRGTLSVSIAWQAQKWYGINIKSTGYVDQIYELKNWCDNHGKYLVIRDWSYIDYAAHSVNQNNPSNKSSGFLLLKKHFEVRSFAFVRDAIDVGLSCGLDHRTAAYKQFIGYLIDQNIPIFKYEDFCSHPDATLRAIGETLNIATSSTWLAIPTSCNITGDTSVSRGNVRTSVVKMRRKYVSVSIRGEINQNTNIAEANRLLGYPLKYESVERESFFEDFSFRLRRRLGFVKC